MLRIIVAALLVCGAVTESTPYSTDSPEMPDYLTVHKVVGNWEEAVLDCKSEGAVIASPINTELLNIMKHFIGVNNTPYLIGTRTRDNPRLFTSMEGVRLEHMGASVLAMTQQLDPREGGCLSMDQHSIRVVPCRSRLPFMCYSAQLAHGNDTYTLMCGIQGYKLNVKSRSCYKLHKERKTWDDAEETCVAEGAHLVVLDNQNEAQFITSMDIEQNYPYTHIGIRDPGNGEWKSVTGKPFADLYIDWQGGSPTYFLGAGCGTIRPSAKIDDYSCTENSTFICEKLSII